VGEVCGAEIHLTSLLPVIKTLLKMEKKENPMGSICSQAKVSLEIEA
jgi:hypothetical protein